MRISRRTRRSLIMNGKVSVTRRAISGTRAMGRAIPQAKGKGKAKANCNNSGATSKSQALAKSFGQQVNGHGNRKTKVFVQ